MARWWQLGIKSRCCLLSPATSASCHFLEAGSAAESQREQLHTTQALGRAGVPGGVQQAGRTLGFHRTLCLRDKHCDDLFCRPGRTTNAAGGRTGDPELPVAHARLRHWSSQSPNTCACICLRNQIHELLLKQLRTASVPKRPSAKKRALRPKSALRSGDETSSRIAPANAPASPGGTQAPACSAKSASSLPSGELATTGRPLARMPSNLEGSTRSAASSLWGEDGYLQHLANR